MKQEEYIISGMSCAACSASVQRVVSRLEGVENCDVNLITGKMTVSYDEEKTGQADFTRVVEKRGLEYAPIPPRRRKNRKQTKRKRAASAVLWFRRYYRLYYSTFQWGKC